MNAYITDFTATCLCDFLSRFEVRPRKMGVLAIGFMIAKKPMIIVVISNISLCMEVVLV